MFTPIHIHNASLVVGEYVVGKVQLHMDKVDALNWLGRNPYFRGYITTLSQL